MQISNNEKTQRKDLKNMKKLMRLFMSMLMVLGLVACSGTNNATSSTSSASSTAPDANKVLVVYFSATGNSKRVAEEIASDTGGDLFEITPAQPYTDEDLDWTDENSRVSREHDDESLQNVELTTTEVPDWSSYSTVFIGYPIWWGIAAWPVDSFVKANNFDGKTIYPFCTSSSSGLGDSASHLAQLAGTGNWQEGQRFSSSASAEDVQEWVNGLGLSK